MFKKLLPFAAIAVAVALIWHFFSPGPLVMIGALVGLVFVHELGHWIVARLFGIEVEVFSIGMGSKPALPLGKLWGTRFQITPWLIGGYVKIEPNSDAFRSKAIWKRALVMFAGVAMNIAIALPLLFGLFITVGTPQVTPESVSVHQVEAPAAVVEKLPLKVGDKFISVDGEKIRSMSELAEHIAKRPDNERIQFIIERNGAQTTVSLTRAELMEANVIVNQLLVTEYERLGVVEAAGASVEKSWDLGTRLIEGVGMMVGAVDAPADMPAGATAPHSVLSIVQIGDDAVEAGIYATVMIICAISLNLAVFNLLPLPVLDGGHLLFLAIEKVRGKPVSLQTQGVVTIISLVLLFGLFAWGIANDIINPVHLR